MEYYVEGGRAQAKIFFALNRSVKNRADDKLNAWLADNPGVKIVDFQYQAGEEWHSIAILYKTKHPDGFDEPDK